MLKDEIKLHNKLHKDRTDFTACRSIFSQSVLQEMKAHHIIDDYYSNNEFSLINGDCVAVMKYLIKKGIKVDHIITDIPYGTVQGLAIEGWKNKGTTPTWDSPIDIKEMLHCCFNISKSNANLILFSQEPMTFHINYELAIFQKYSLSNKMIWVKNNHANGFSSKTTPLNYYEEMLLLRKCLDADNSIEIRKYFSQVLAFIGRSKKEIMQELGQGLDHCFRYTQRTFYIPIERNYQALIDTYHIDKMSNFIPYQQLKKQWDRENTVIFNIPSGQKIVKNVFEYKKDINNIHPTQKPLALLKQLISIFSDEEDTILDFTCGSASAGIAAVSMNRKFIGIEKDKIFFDKAIQWYQNSCLNRLF